MPCKLIDYPTPPRPQAQFDARRVSCHRRVCRELDRLLGVDRLTDVDQFYLRATRGKAA